MPDKKEIEFVDQFVHACWIIDDESSTVVHANQASEKIGHPPEAVTGKTLESLLVFDLPEVKEGVNRFLLRNAGKDITCRLRQVFLQLPTDLSSTVGPGEPLMIRIIRREGHSVLILRPVLSPLVKEYVSNTQDFLVVLDENDAILRLTPNWFLIPFLRSNRIIGEPVTRLVPAQAWAQFKRARASALDYVRSHAQTVSAIWPAGTAVDFGKDALFAQDEQRLLWKLDKKTGAAFSGKDEGYLYFKDKMPVEGCDFSMTLDIVPSSGGRAALVFNQQRPGKWDTLGYNAGLSFTAGPAVATLKKNTRFVLYQECGKVAAGETTLRVEKIGGIIRIFINNAHVAEYADPAPVPNSNAYAGVLVSGGVRLKRFELSTKPSGFKYGKALPPAFRVQVSPLPHRYFDLSPVTFEDWSGRDLPVITEALLFRDVTELARVEQDRDELDRKYRIVKRKEYFGFVGGNEKILELMEQVDHFADSRATVLVEGPTGAGKEVLARAIHARSNRRDKPFVKVDCASLPQTLLESELFGHEKGAFTGAVSRVQGRFEMADKGTLFLDEIGNIDVSMQAKLLGFLEDHTFTPLGGRQPIKVDVRIIAATNAPLEKRVGEGLFREDLFYRLKVFHVHLPALRERLDDLPLLVDSFIKAINERHAVSIEGVAPAVMEKLLTHAWPGNVRELFNLLVNLSVQKKKGVIDRVPEFFTARGETATALPPERLRMDTLLAFAKVRGFFSIRECRGQMPGSLATIRRDLAKLVGKKLLTLEGKGPGARYFPGKP